jgi:hypothetical protein
MTARFGDDQFLTDASTADPALTGGDGWRLWTLAPEIAVEHRFSRIFQGQHELIDHILIGHALLGRLTFVDADVCGLSSIGVNPDTRRNASASDHAPVIARFG